MHSRIIQVSSKPIDRDDWITEDRYYDGFVGQIADYVDSETDREGDIEWLSAILNDAVKFDKDSFTIIDRDKYFAKKYEAFLDSINKLQNISFDEFSCKIPTNLSLLMYDIQKAYSNEYGFYIDDNYEYAGTQTLDDFMRHVSNGDVFYIGAIFDYHY